MRLEDIIEGTEIASPATFGGEARNDDGKTQFNPYYLTHTKIQTLALLDEKHKGSNWYVWRRGRDLNSRYLSVHALSKRAP